MKIWNFIVVLIFSIIGGIAGYFVASKLIDPPTGYGGSAGALEGFFITMLYFSAISFGFGIAGLLTLRLNKVLINRRH